MSNPTSTSLEVFFDPSARQVVKIYLDTVHLNGQLYIRLRNIIEVGHFCNFCLCYSLNNIAHNRMVGDVLHQTRKPRPFGSLTPKLRTRWATLQKISQYYTLLG